MTNDKNEPIINQPKNDTSVCPPGLQILLSIDYVRVKQNVEYLEALTGCETRNSYEILNSSAVSLFTAIEITNCCALCCCGYRRCFNMKVLDKDLIEVMRFDRPLRCIGSCFPLCCCGQKILAYAPPGQFIGEVKQLFDCCGAHFEIMDENHQPKLRIRGPCHLGMCSKVNFQILPMKDSTQIGTITKEFGGFSKELLCDADNFGISFPMDLDVRMKALLLAQLILIDFLFFENTKK